MVSLRHYALLLTALATSFAAQPVRAQSFTRETSAPLTTQSSQYQLASDEEVLDFFEQDLDLSVSPVPAPNLPLGQQQAAQVQAQEDLQESIRREAFDAAHDADEAVLVDADNVACIVPTVLGLFQNPWIGGPQIALHYVGAAHFESPTFFNAFDGHEV